ncbi:CpsD/CapB family tyrosine-protein kinase [Salinarimonas sp.]|uniref:CpsD/CapB family tyrosine-protein kinase n=1 Tax=Salinarimonas sp. TaxID=2766526 RepID=UPI0032D8B5CA
MRELVQPLRDGLRGRTRPGVGGASRALAPDEIAAPPLVGRGTIALAPKALRRADVLAAGEGKRRAREIDMLRTYMLHKMEAQNACSLAVIGAQRGVGATFTAVNLAWSMARRRDQRILLVDANLRSPALSSRFSLSTHLGLTHYLEGRAELEECVYEVESGGKSLLVMPCTASDEAAELLASRRMNELLDRLRRSRPEVVAVLDLPALLWCDDALGVLPKLDSALLVVAAGRTRRAEIDAVAGLVSEDKLAGVVLNDYR